MCLEILWGFLKNLLRNVKSLKPPQVIPPPPPFNSCIYLASRAQTDRTGEPGDLYALKTAPQTSPVLRAPLLGRGVILGGTKAGLWCGDLSSAQLLPKREHFIVPRAASVKAVDFLFPVIGVLGEPLLGSLMYSFNLRVSSAP